MKGVTFDIYIDEYLFTIEVDYFHSQKADFRADNPDDYFGYNELEYTVLGCSAIDEDGEVVELSLSEAESLAEKVEDIITEKLLEEIREYGDDDYY